MVRICFYQERIQVNEAKHLAFWQDHHPGERMLDIGSSFSSDIFYSFGLFVAQFSLRLIQITTDASIVVVSILTLII